MRWSLLYSLSGLVILLSSIVSAVPASSFPADYEQDADNDNHIIEENSETSSDLELPPPSPAFDRAHLPIVYHPQINPRYINNRDPPTRSLLSPRELVSIKAHANSSTFVDSMPLAVSAKGGGFSTGKSKTSADKLGYSYQGCWKEPPTDGLRLLTGAFLNSDSMTIPMCQAFCDVFPYYGLEFKTQCFCGSFLSPGGVLSTEGNCQDPCAGLNTTICGGGGYVSLYYDPSLLPGPNNPPVFAGSNLVGCYVDALEPRTLAGTSTSSDTSMSLALCSSFCLNLSYTYWGVEFGNQCYCSNAITVGRAQVGAEECPKQCTGDRMQLCGGSDRVMIYHKNP